jgi:hypothetical protein
VGGVGGNWRLSGGLRRRPSRGRLLEAYRQGAWQRWIDGAGGWIRRNEDGRKRKERKEIERRKNRKYKGIMDMLSF